MPVPARRRTKSELIDEVFAKHGAVFDLSVTEDCVYVGSKARVFVRCTVCGRKWHMPIERLLHRGARCRCVFNTKQRITYDVFLKRVLEIHGTTIDFSLVVPIDIKGQKSEVNLLCTKPSCPHFTEAW